MYFSTKEFHAAVVRGIAAVAMPADDNWYRRNIDRNVARGRRQYPNEVMRKTGKSVSFREAARYLKKAKHIIINRTFLRDGNPGTIGNAYKWLRPWDIVPELKNFAPGDGDFGVGVEVEMGFVSTEAAVEICNDCKNWKHVTADYEGGIHPIEMTFPPMLYSKISNKSQVMRYLDLLTTKSHLVYQHAPRSNVGTHVNVSVPASLHQSRSDAALHNSYLINAVLMSRLSESQKIKYFGRRPYGYLYNQGSFWECKLFNSTTDKAALKRYINIAVGLVKLAYEDVEITEESVVARLEKGYNKKGFKKFD